MGEKQTSLEPVNGNATIYSHSRLSTFEQCPLKFRFGYIDKLETEVTDTVEAFLGSRVHETLEKLYKDLKFEKLNSLKDLLEFFNAEWDKNWNKDILIVRDEYSPENFRKMGERFITDYYERYKPFDQARTLGLETRIVIKLDPEGKYVLQGYIDRLSDAGDGVYEIHDYKTANSLPEQEKLDRDRQLALYSIAVKEMYRDAKKVVLIWHYLAFDKELRSERSDEQLEKLRADTISVIQRIESATEFEPKESALCNWCEFQPHCPKFSHQFKTKDLTPEQFKKEDGVKLVDEYTALKAEETAIASKLAELSEKIYAYSDQHKADRLIGSDARITVWKKNTVKFPGRKDPGYPELVKILRETGAWDEFSVVDRWALEKAFSDVDMDPKVMQAIAKLGKKELIKRLYPGRK